MHRLLYISTAREALKPTALDLLLVEARRNNAAVDVTGLLVVGGKRFLQALEGPEGAVRAVYERIRKDPRHFAIVSLIDQQIPARAFPDWSMGCRIGGSILGQNDLVTTVAQLVAPIEDPTLRAYFTGFSETHVAA